MDRIESELRTYYETEAAEQRRPDHGDRRRNICAAFAAELAATDPKGAHVVDIGAGPASDAATFEQAGVRYLGVDLALGNGVLAAAHDRTVVPASLFALPFADGAFRAGWSMSTYQHVPDDRIDEALAEFARVLAPGAPLTIGLWGGRNEVIESESSTSGIQLPRHFTLRSHDHIRSILRRHFVLGSDETFLAGGADWEYHVATMRAPA